MKKITQRDLDKLKARGVTVKSKVAPKKETKNQTTTQPGNSESLKANTKAMEKMSDNLERYMNQKKSSWRFKVNRNNKGSITTVDADPVG